MKLSIIHETRYRYRNPVSLTPHRLMMTPRSTHELTTLSSTLCCFPQASTIWSQDVFGNMIATAMFAEPTVELTIRHEALVEQCASTWPILRIDLSAHTFPFAYSADDAADLGVLRGATDGSRIEAWAKSLVLGPATDTLSLLKDINIGILGFVSYRVRDEEGTQSPEETLDMASGSCRDIAALFIAAVRSLGFGARAVSGYLYDPDQIAGDGGATHAWAEVYLPGAGWIAFDPTHRRMGSANLVSVAVGRSNRQIMPVTGGFSGAADDALDMEVKVEVVAA